MDGWMDERMGRRKRGKKRVQRINGRKIAKLTYTSSNYNWRDKTKDYGLDFYWTFLLVFVELATSNYIREVILCDYSSDRPCHRIYILHLVILK